MKKIYALVDCNNFYASCERIFRPDLRQRAVVVLSNNDGCVVARSAEAKALGIGMAVPFFQVKDLIKKHNIAVFSSNYALYGDISQRVMTLLEEQVANIEVYSIDEAFLDLTELAQYHDLAHFSLQIKQQVLQETGIHVCIGIAPSRTLAKLANHAAKQYPATKGVVDLRNRVRQQKLLSLLAVDEVWGVGRRTAQHLNRLNIHTALQLAQSSPQFIRQQGSVTLERTVRELNGEDCIHLSDFSKPKQIMCSRSFGYKVEQFNEMSEAVASYTAKAVEKLRRSSQLAKVATVYVRSTKNKNGRYSYANSATAQLIVPSDDTREFLYQTEQLIQRLWKQGYRYAKAGVILSELYEPNTFQGDLFDALKESKSKPHNRALMTLIDQVNVKGESKLFFAAQGLGQAWKMKQHYLSPRYTTRWHELPKVK